ncbi:MAG: two-component regulator propeller domain-containing protein [Candidatus Aminicenantaceae bacterium]
MKPAKWASFLLLVSISLSNISCSRNQKSWINFTSANFVNTIAVEGNYVWTGSGGGVVKWDMSTGEYTKYISADGLADNVILSIAIDSEGNKWFGKHGGGVSKFDGANWTTYTTDDGLVDNRVLSIAMDLDGNMWFGTRAGLSFFGDPATFKID